MSSRLVVTGLAAVFVMTLVLVGPGAAGCAALAQAPAGQARLGAAPPGTHGVPGDPPGLRPEQIEKRISPEEREKLALAEPTWVAQYGKVHPDVRAVLETGQMPWVRFKGWEPIGFEGTAYVAVHLRIDEGRSQTAPEREAAIRRVQSRVLSRLTAAEFVVAMSFKSIPAILGYVNRAGAAKLSQDSDVLAVGLDDRPVPERPVGPRPEPPPRGVVQGPAERRGNVEVRVYEALERSPDGYVEVCVSLRYAPPSPAVSAEADRAQDRAARDLQDRVLSSLTADEFRLQSRSPSLLDGYVNSAGLARLASHPDVTAVGGLGHPGGTGDFMGKRR